MRATFVHHDLILACAVHTQALDFSPCCSGGFLKKIDLFELHIFVFLMPALNSLIKDFEF